MTTRRLLLVALIAVVAGGSLGGAGTTVGAPASGAATDGDVGDAVRHATANDTRIVHEGDALTLQSGPGRAVRGATDLAPGTELTVRLRSSDAGNPYLRSATTTVDSNGTFRAVFDLSEVPAGTSLEVLVHRDGANLTTATADVVECQDGCTSEVPATPSAVVPADGGELTLANDSGQAVRGRTNLPPGSEVAVGLRSTDGPAPFVKQVRTVVDADGTFRAVFDFGALSTPVDVTAAVRFDGTTLTTTNGRVECTGDCPTGEPAGGDGYADAEVGVVQVANGSVARIPVRLGDADAAVLSVGGPDGSYGLEATVVDGSDDGEVVVLLNTAAAGRSVRPASAADAGDELRMRTERGSLRATEYRLLLHPPDDESRTVATGLLVVTQDGDAGTPLLTDAPHPGSTLPLGSAAALLLGAVLAVAGLAFLLGLVER